MEMRAKKSAARGKQVARPAAEAQKAKPVEKKLKLTDAKPKTGKPDEQKAAASKDEADSKLKAAAPVVAEAKPEEEERDASEPREEPSAEDLADMIAETSAARAMVWAAARRPQALQREASAAKFYCTDTALSVCTRAMDLLGNHALLHG